MKAEGEGGKRGWEARIRGGGRGGGQPAAAMLKVIRGMLDLNTLDGKLTWAAVCTGFHFMMRSAEYLAKESGGRFDLDRVLRVKDGGVHLLRSRYMLLTVYKFIALVP